VKEYVVVYPLIVRGYLTIVCANALFEKRMAEARENLAIEGFIAYNNSSIAYGKER
jgi:hypothetical protein